MMPIDLTVPAVKAATKRAHYLRLLNNILAVITGFFPTEIFRGLHVRTHPSDTTKVQLIRADEVVMSDGTRLSVASPLEADIDVAGAGGLDTGSPVNSTWYEVHLIAKDDGTKAVLLHRAKDWFLDESQTVVNDTGGWYIGALAAFAKIAQGFQVDTAGSVPFVDLTLTKVGAPTDLLYLDVCADSGGNPGTVLATSEPVPASGLTTVNQNVARFLFRTPAELAALSQYHLVARRSGAVDNVNFVYWRYDSTAPYARGQVKTWDGVAWTGQTHDATFRIYVTRNEAAVTLPAGYTKSALLCPGIYRESGGGFRPTVVQGRRAGWRHVSIGSTSSTFPVLMDLATHLPPRLVTAEVAFSSTVAGDHLLVSGVPDGFDGVNGAPTDQLFSATVAAQVECGKYVHTEAQGLYLKRNAGTGSVSLWCKGYEW